MSEYQVIAHPPVFKIFDLTRAEEKARRDDLRSRERNQVATAEHIGQSPLLDTRILSLGQRGHHRPMAEGMHMRACVVQHSKRTKCRDGSETDIWHRPLNVRFTPKSGHWLSVSECLLCAKSVKIGLSPPH